MAISLLNSYERSEFLTAFCSACYLSGSLTVRVRLGKRDSKTESKHPQAFRRPRLEQSSIRSNLPDLQKEIENTKTRALFYGKPEPGTLGFARFLDCARCVFVEARGKQSRS